MSVHLEDTCVAHVQLYAHGHAHASSWHTRTRTPHTRMYTHTHSHTHKCIHMRRCERRTRTQNALRRRMCIQLYMHNACACMSCLYTYHSHTLPTTLDKNMILILILDNAPYHHSLDVDGFRPDGMTKDAIAERLKTLKKKRGVS